MSDTKYKYISLDSDSVPHITDTSLTVGGLLEVMNFWRSSPRYHADPTPERQKEKAMMDYIASLCPSNEMLIDIDPDTLDISWNINTASDGNGEIKFTRTEVLRALIKMVMVAAHNLPLMFLFPVNEDVLMEVCEYMLEVIKGRPDSEFADE